MFSIPSLETITYELSNLSPDNVTKIHKIITGILVVCLAFFSARLFVTGINSVLGSMKTQKPVVQQNMRPAESVKKSLKSEKSDYDIITSRNIFNSKGEIPEEEAIDSKGAGTDMAKRTTLEIELVGTIVVSDPTRSIAAIMLKKESKIEPFMVNDIILSKAVVVNIARRKVLLKNTVTGDLEFVEIKEDDAPIGQQVAAAPAGGIRVISDDHVVIDRGELDRSLNNINELLVQARVIPNMEDGRITGYKIFGIQPGSLYDKIGAKNGDIIKAVNGAEMNSPASAMNMYQQLRTSPKFDFNIVRDGVNKTMQIDIR